MLSNIRLAGCFICILLTIVAQILAFKLFLESLIEDIYLENIFTKEWCYLKIIYISLLMSGMHCAWMAALCAFTVK